MFSVKETEPPSSEEMSLALEVEAVAVWVRVGSRSRFIAIWRRIDVRWSTSGIRMGPGWSSRREVMHCLIRRFVNDGAVCRFEVVNHIPCQSLNLPCFDEWCVAWKVADIAEILDDALCELCMAAQ